MNKNIRTAPAKRQPMPIRFWKLEVGSEYEIFAEPSRGIQKSKDKRTYVKTAESYSIVKGTEGTAEEVVAILMPEDLVVPKSRPQQAK